ALRSFVYYVDPAAIVTLLLLGAASWVVASLVFTGISEPHDAHQDAQEEDSESDSEQQGHWWTDPWQLFTQDRKFRDFVIVRSLMLVSALSSSSIVALSHAVGNDSLSGLAGFVLDSGLA